MPVDALAYPNICSPISACVTVSEYPHSAAFISQSARSFLKSALIYCSVLAIIMSFNYRGNY